MSTSETVSNSTSSEAEGGEFNADGSFIPSAKNLKRDDSFWVDLVHRFSKTCLRDLEDLSLKERLVIIGAFSASLANALVEAREAAE